MCESHALDSLNNALICGEGEAETDTRPNRIGRPCSDSVSNSWMDIVVIVDVSTKMSNSDLKAVSDALINVLTNLNLDSRSQHSSRIALITFATLPKIQFNFDEVTTSTKLGSALNLTRYRSFFDGNRNAAR